MADKSFGIKELNLIGASGTPTITSPNNLNLNASNVAISTDVTVGRHLDVDGHAEFDAVNVAGVSTFAGITTVSGPSLFTNQLSVSGVSTFLSAINVSSSYGTSGQVLTSQGSGSAPQWATPAAAGKILQVVTTDYTGLFSTSTDNTWTQVSSLDCTINLASSSSKVLIIVSLGQVSSANDVGSAWDIRRDGTAILQGVSDGSRIPCTFKVGCYQPSHASAATFTGIDSPGSSGSKTYQIYCRSQGGTTLYLNRTNNNEDATDTYAARPASHLTLMEIAS